MRLFVPQGPAGSDGPPGKEGVLGQRVRTEFLKGYKCSTETNCRYHSREIEGITVQRVWLVLRDFLGLPVPLVSPEKLGNEDML